MTKKPFVTKEKLEAMHAEGMKYRQTSPWTVRKLLRTKETDFMQKKIVLSSDILLFQ